jgi:hypothetical protein
MHMIHQLQGDPHAHPGYTWQVDELCHKDRIVLVWDSSFKSKVLSKLHSFPIAVHFWFHKTYYWIKHSLFWEGMKKDIHTIVVECDTCQQYERENGKSSRGLTTLTHSCNSVK